MLAKTCARPWACGVGRSGYDPKTAPQERAPDWITRLATTGLQMRSRTMNSRIRLVRSPSAAIPRRAPETRRGQGGDARSCKNAARPPGRSESCADRDFPPSGMVAGFRLKNSPGWPLESPNSTGSIRRAPLLCSPSCAWRHHGLRASAASLDARSARLPQMMRAVTAAFGSALEKSQPGSWPGASLHPTRTNSEPSVIASLNESGVACAVGMARYRYLNRPV